MIEKFKYFVHTVLPTVYDDSLSYSELWGKLVNKLNEVIDETNSALDEIDTFENNVNAEIEQFENSTESRMGLFEQSITSLYDTFTETMTDNFTSFVTTVGSTISDFEDYVNGQIDDYKQYMDDKYTDFFEHYIQTLGVVQTTGTSTTDVMSQKAVSDSIEAVPKYGKVLWNGPANAAVVTIDRTNKTITFGSSAFLLYGNRRLSLGNKSCTYTDTGSSNQICYYSSDDNQIHAVQYNSFNPNANTIILFDFIRDSNGVDGYTIPFNYSIDGVKCIVKEKEVITPPEVVFISPNGSNTNTGTVNSPFATLRYAIESGFKNICVFNGEYKITSPMRFNNYNGIKIYAYNNDTYPSPPVKRDRPVFHCGETYSNFTTDDGMLIFTPVSVPNSYVNVFVSKTTPPMSEGTRPSPNACLWVHYTDKTKDIKLTPVLDYETLSATNDSFWYDETYVYMRITDTNITSATIGLDVNEILQFSVCNNIEINGISFKYGRQNNLIVEKSNNFTAKNCTFEYTTAGNGVSTDFSDTIFENCESFNSRNDGFNCHYYGISTYINCHSHYNGDDGESSHEYCKIIVNGGEYDHNHKGGHSPVNGCSFYDNGSYSHHNAYGYYCIAQGSQSATYDMPEPLIMNGVSINNTTDVFANRINVNVGNTKYLTTSIAGGGSITNLNT